MAILAMIMANSPLSHLYGAFLDMPLEVRVGSLEVAKPLILWINDGLMAIFFFLVGLELKREVISGHLSKPSNLILPAQCSSLDMIKDGGVLLLTTYS